jgi:cell division protein FtsL
MTESRSPRRISGFPLTPRQRRLRLYSFVIIGFIVAMIIFAMTHPFFRPSHLPVVTETARRALIVKTLFLMGYWTICFLLLLSLLVIAWLYTREIMRQLMVERARIWRELADRSNERMAERMREKRQGNGRGTPQQANGTADDAD